MPRQTIQAWSPSLLETFEKCRYWAKLKAVDKVKEPERPPLPDGKEYPNDRGSRLHDEGEAFVKGEGPFTAGLRHFREEFELLKELYEEGRVTTEQLWAFDNDWEQVPGNAWGEHWARLKVDALVIPWSARAVVIDYKSGKRDGNEIKHADQVMQYGIATLMKLPEVEEVIVELWYLDKNVLVSQRYDRLQLMRYLRSLTARGTECTTTTQFPPNPSSRTCFFCPYKTGLIGKMGPEGTGHCKVNPV